MTRRDGRISSTDPSCGQPITVEVRSGAWRFEPATTVVLAATTTAAGERCGPVADCCCPYINFHANPRDADAYHKTHLGMAGELLDQAEAVRRPGASSAACSTRTAGTTRPGGAPVD